MTDPAYRPDPATRPNTVTWALRLWLISGALLVVIGVTTLVLSLFDGGWDMGVIAVEFMVTAVGLAYVALARRAFCEPQWRGALAALTVVAVAMLLILAVGFRSPGLAVVLAAAVIGLFGSLFAYRPDADAWFTGKDPDDEPAPKSKKRR